MDTLIVNRSAPARKPKSNLNLADKYRQADFECARIMIAGTTGRYDGLPRLWGRADAGQ